MRDGTGLIVAVTVGLAGCNEPPQRRVGFGTDTLVQHRVSGRQMIEVAGIENGHLNEVSVVVTIDTDGHVIRAHADHDNVKRANPAQAIAEVRRWRFRPFTYRGRPVVATGTVTINYRPFGVWADPSRDLPPIDYATLRIGLSRRGCFGDCPIYRVVVDGAGMVTYASPVEVWEDGGKRRRFNGNGVLVTGSRHSRISRAALDGLIEKFRAAHFFGLKPEYVSKVTDQAQYEIEFATGGRTMRVIDYVGDQAGMPAAATALESEIDRITGTAHWVTGDAVTLFALRAGGFNPKSADAVDLAQGALRRENDQLLIDLISVGLRLDQPAKDMRGDAVQPLGQVLLTEALRFGRVRAVRALIDRGWLARLPTGERATLFADSAGGCDPVVAKAFIAAGTDPNAHGSAHGWGLSNGKDTALHAAVAPYGPCQASVDRAALIKTLIGLGVNPNGLDAKGQTPIFGEEDPEVLMSLLKLGARANAKDVGGRSAVFSSWTDVIVLTLLDAGADPRGKDEDGKSLRTLAKVHSMPGTLAWLDAHKVP